MQRNFQKPIKFLLDIKSPNEMVGPYRFAEESQAMIDSPDVPAEVKPIFQSFITGINAAKPCLIEANLECLRSAFKKIGEKGMKEGMILSTGKLQELFQEMLRLDQQTVKEMTELRNNKKDGGKIATQITDYVLNHKASLVQNYRGKQ